MSSQEKPISGKLVTASDGSFVLVLDSPPGGKTSTQIASKLAFSVGMANKSKTPHTNQSVGVVKLNNTVTDAKVCENTGSVGSNVTVNEESKISLTHPRVSSVTENNAVVRADVSKKTVSMVSNISVADRSKTNPTYSGGSSITKTNAVVEADFSKKTESVVSNISVADGSKTNLTYSGVSSITKNSVVVGADVSKKTVSVASSISVADRSKTNLTYSGVSSIMSGSVPSSVTVIHRSKRSILHPSVSNVNKNSAATGVDVSEIKGLVTSNVQIQERNRADVIQPGIGSIFQNSAVVDPRSTKTVKESVHFSVVDKGKIPFLTPVASRIIFVDGKQASVQLINGKKTIFINPGAKQNAPVIEANVRSNTAPVKIKTLNSPVIINCSTSTATKDSPAAGLPNSITSAAGLPNSITPAAGLPDVIRSSSAKYSASSTVGRSSKVDYTSSMLPSSTSLLSDSKNNYVPMISMAFSKRDKPVSADALSSLKEIVTNIQPIMHSSTNVIQSILKSDTKSGAEMKQMGNSESQICTSTSKEHSLVNSRKIHIVRPSVEDSVGILKEVKVVTSTSTKLTQVSDSATQCLTSNPVPSKLFSHTAAAKMIPTSLITTTQCNELLKATGRYTPNNMRISMSPPCSSSLVMSKKDSTSFVMPQIGSSSLIIPQKGSVSHRMPQMGSTSLVMSQTGSKPLMANTGSKPMTVLQTCSTPLHTPHTTSISSSVPQTRATSIIPVSSSLSTTTQLHVLTTNTKTVYAASNAPFYSPFETPSTIQISLVNNPNVTKSNASNSVCMRMLPDTESNEEHFPPTVTITIPPSGSGSPVGRELKSSFNGQQLENSITLKNVASHTPLVSSSFSRNIVSNSENTESITNNRKLDYFQKPDDPEFEPSLTTINREHSAKNITSSATETVSFETSPLKLKIDSVFSLSNKTFEQVNTTEDEDCTRPFASSDVNASGSTSPSDSVGRKDLTNVLDPCYPVLEKLSEKQISYLMSTTLQKRAVARQKLRKRHRLIDSKYESDALLERKCSSYCRKRTLNFLCRLGMLSCQKTKRKPKDVDNVAPKHACDDGENNKTNFDHPSGPINVTSDVSGFSPVATNVTPSSKVLSHVTKVLSLGTEKEVKTTTQPKTSGPVQLQLVIMNNKLFLVPTSNSSGSSNSVSSITNASGNITCGPNSKCSSLVSDTPSQKTNVSKSANITTSEKVKQINVVSTETRVTTSGFQQNSSTTNMNSDAISPRGKIPIPPHKIPTPVVIYGPFSSDGNRPSEISKILGKTVFSTHPSAVTNIYDHRKTSAFRRGPSATRTFSILKTQQPLEARASRALSQPPTESQTIRATQTAIDSKTPKKTKLIIAPDVMKKLNTTKKQTESVKVPPWKLPWNYEIKSEPVTEGYGDEEDGMNSDIVNTTASDRVIANHPSALQSVIDSSTSSTCSIDIGNVHPTTYITQTDLPSKLAKTGQSDQKSRIERLKEILREKERMLDDLKRKRSFASILHCNE